MKLRILHIATIVLVLQTLVVSCVEEIPLESENFESILIVEATITDQNITQEILLSRSYQFEESEPIQESGANVVITDDLLNDYHFSEASPGKYVSNFSFAAQPDRVYNLRIVTADGSTYSSEDTELTETSSIDNLYVERDFNEDGTEGVSVYVDSYDATNASKYYRHEYEETYKIIAPQYSPEELISNGVEFPILQDEQPIFNSLEELIDFLVTRKFRDQQEQICYNTEKSKHLILTSTNDLVEDRLDKYRVKFINRNSFTIRHRYSILVRQFIQSLEAYTFYETLNSFSESENLLSENQPGFLEGNLVSESSLNPRVFGFFEVSSVDEKRIFFNYEDLFGAEDLPPYVVDCDEFFTPALLAEDFAHNWTHSPLVNALNEGYQFYEDNVDSNNSPFFHAPFRLVLEQCGDCTVLGENSEPDFWED